MKVAIMTSLSAKWYMQVDTSHAAKVDTAVKTPQEQYKSHANAPRKSIYIAAKGISFAIPTSNIMYHATINGTKKIDIEWDGKRSEVILDGKTFITDVLIHSDSNSHWIHNNKSYNVEIVQLNQETKELQIKVNGTIYQVQLKDRFDDLLKSLGMEGVGQAKLKDLKAPMPGLVLDIMVNEGQSVEKDSPLVILEAMKMENVIKSPATAVVKKVNAIKGQAVEKNTVLIEFA
jgi:acetyl/propionyl-CoA carboxylase alpha subunit